MTTDARCDRSYVPSHRPLQMSIVDNVSEESDVVQTRRLNLGDTNNRNTLDLQLSFTFVTD